MDGEKLFGHFFRADRNEPLREASITAAMERPPEEYKRGGRPREHWTEANINRVSNKNFEKTSKKGTSST